ncbi:MAG: polysaccharide biosynthesis protein [Phycisphaeraceae bacterium]|nr:polysaccharide biosynthesis protein [Phycisphaeraceae bacterium]
MPTTATNRQNSSATPATPTPAILVGTAQTLSLLVDQLRLVPGAPSAVAFVDVDSPNAIAELGKAAREAGAKLAIISLPSAMTKQMEAARGAVRAAGLQERIVPPLMELLENAPARTDMTFVKSRREIDVTDLIGRTPYGVDRRAVAGVLEGARVLITGAGGSIGSEIARIAATFRPGCLMLMERSENALFEIDRQIARKFPDVKRRALLHDIADADATMRHVLELKPDVVFHAAAHKHVPLMEDHPAHALTNNLFGTKSVADAALASGAKRFVLISSDKAVNPTSVMGATKRLAEMYTQGLHRQARAGTRGTKWESTSFSMVRFGNVLGSACSVLPIWSTQIAEGGPITVTDPRMTRYFMTIHEAAMLVIQSAAIEPGPDAAVFVLDMGDPVKIMDLAMRFVRAHGFEPVVREKLNSGSSLSNQHSSPFPQPLPPTLSGKGLQSADSGLPLMEVAVTGKRPGEKLYEELCYAAEQLRETPFPGINAWAGELRSDFNLPAMMAELGAARQMVEKEAVVRAIRKHVPEMRASEIEARPVALERAA